MADAMATVAPNVRAYFATKEGEVGARMLAAWESGIRDSLGLVRGLEPVKAIAPKVASKVAKSDGLVLEFLRQRGGSATGTLKAIAASVGVPQSTLANSVKRLTERGLVNLTSRRIALVRGHAGMRELP